MSLDQYTEEEKTAALIFAAAAVLTVLLVCATGCASAPPIPCLPDIEYQEVAVQTPCVISVDLLPPLILPEYPPFEPTKEWAAQAQFITKEIRSILEARDKAYAKKLTGHNSLEPACASTH